MTGRRHAGSPGQRKPIVVRRDGCAFTYEQCEECLAFHLIDFDTLTDAELSGECRCSERPESPDYALLCKCKCSIITCVIIELKGGSFKVSKAKTQLQSGADYIAQKFSGGERFHFTALVCRPRNSRKSPFEERELSKARITCKGKTSRLHCLEDGASVSEWLCCCASLC